MNCQSIRKLIDGYLDEELDLVNHLEIENHLSDCAACSDEYENRRALKSAFDESFYFHAPAGLRKKIQTELRRSGSESTRRQFWQWRWLALAGPAAAIILLSFFLLREGPANNEPLVAEMVSNHVRSMMVNHLTDVPSTDQHTVKPWFEGKLNFSPPVINLDSQGYTLIGGRLDYAAGRPVAALVYQRRQHIINLFIYPSTGNVSSESKVSTQQGFNLIHWEKSGMAFWAVSDLNVDELRDFANDIQK
jgi:Predicted transmembrane transcriptional regulator (anti-sigma factor)